jgi:two-component system cell cycle sensor histidine kinase PleC
MVLADEMRLKQAMLNLLSNAVKFTPPGGRIEIAAALSEDGGIETTIADTGIGMRPEDIPVALEPFRQIDSKITRNYGGTGLGLPLARRLTELHGGYLKIASAVGLGTTVTMGLPRTRVAAEAQRRAAVR